ncbi:hypothetical protein ASD74_06420 [Rhizobium sp. Root564]|nr:hypothetical protein ASD74_06420 [Rhizobium sp. Root564]
MVDLTKAMTPSSVVETFRSRGIQISERTLREKARRIGAFREIGKAMFFMPEDIEALLDSAKPGVAPARYVEASGWSEQDTENLRARLTAKERRT